jgi:uncharacterized membrane protein YfcA
MDIIFPLQTLLLVTLIHGLGAALQGSVGYGMALVSGPILVLIEPRIMPGPFLLSAIVLSVLMTLRERKDLVLGDLVWAIGGRIPGSALAALVVATFTISSLNLTFGLMILLAVGLSLSGIHFPPNRVNLFVAGVLSGIMGTIAAIGGPPVAIVYQKVPGGRLRTNMSVFFLFGTTISVLSLIPAQKMGLEQILLSLNLLPGVLLGFVGSSFLVRHLPPQWMRPAVLGVAAVSAMIIVIQTLR